MGTSRIPQTHAATVTRLQYPEALGPLSQEFPLSLSSAKTLTKSVIELLFASRAMAYDRMTIMASVDRDGGDSVMCRECQRVALVGRQLYHGESCKTGRVLAAIDALGAWTDDLSQSPSERSSSEETPEAGAAVTTPFRTEHHWHIDARGAGPAAVHDFLDSFEVKTEAAL